MTERSRNLLYVKDLKDFANFIVLKGYTVQEPKSEYEVLRIVGGKEINSVYTKLKTCRGNPPIHLTVYGEGLKLAKEFYQQKALKYLEELK